MSRLYHLLLLLLMMFALTSTGFAKLGGAMPLHLGIRAGYGNGEVSGSAVGSDTEPVPASAYGLFVGYWFSPTLSLQSELLFSLRGGIQGRSFDVYHEQTGFFAYHVDARTEWHLSYIEMPVLIKFGKAQMISEGGSGRNFTPFFEYGLSFGAIVDERSKDELDLSYPQWTPIPDGTYEANKPGFGTIEVSFVVGGGGQLQLGPGYAMVQARFRAGMGNIGGDSQKAQTRDILLLAGYGWMLHSR